MTSIDAEKNENADAKPVAETNNNSEKDNHLNPVVVGSNKPNRVVKPKSYRNKNTDLYCKSCDVFCNGQLQFEVHMMSQKHKLNLEFIKEGGNKLNNTEYEASVDENNNNSNECDIQSKDKMSNKIVKTNLHDYTQNLIASQCQINAEKYLIPEDKRKGKYEKFGFYCSLCDSYMTGQIQLVMHVKGAKHQYYSPFEVPGFKPNKIFTPPSHFNNHSSTNNQIKLELEQSEPKKTGNKQQKKFFSFNSVLAGKYHPQKSQHSQHPSYSEYQIKNQQLMQIQSNLNYRFTNSLNLSNQHQANLYQFFNAINSKNFNEMLSLSKSNTNVRFDNNGSTASMTNKNPNFNSNIENLSNNSSYLNKYLNNNNTNMNNSSSPSYSIAGNLNSSSQANQHYSTNIYINANQLARYKPINNVQTNLNKHQQVSSFDMTKSNDLVNHTDNTSNKKINLNHSFFTEQQQQQQTASAFPNQILNYLPPLPPQIPQSQSIHQIHPHTMHQFVPMQTQYLQSSSKHQINLNQNVASSSQHVPIAATASLNGQFSAPLHHQLYYTQTNPQQQQPSQTTSFHQLHTM